MRGWRYNGGTLTDADAGPVEIVVSRLRTDASRSRVMDDGRDAPLTVTLYHKRASRHGEETAPRWVAAGKRDCLPDRAEKETSSSTSASARSASSPSTRRRVSPSRPRSRPTPPCRSSSRDPRRRRRRRRGTSRARRRSRRREDPRRGPIHPRRPPEDQPTPTRPRDVHDERRGRVRGRPRSHGRNLSAPRAVRDHPRVGTPRSSSNPRAHPLVRDAPRHVQGGGARPGGEATGAGDELDRRGARGA